MADNNREFLSACYSGDLFKLQQAMTLEGVDLNYRKGACLIDIIHGVGRTTDKIQLLEYLEGKVVLQTDETLLTWAVYYDTSLIPYFINIKKINPNDDGGLAVAHAIIKRDSTVLDILFKHDAEITPLVFEMVDYAGMNIQECLQEIVHLQKFTAFLKNSTIVAEHNDSTTALIVDYEMQQLTVCGWPGHNYNMTTPY